MRLNLRAFDWNKYALASIGFYVVSLLSRFNLIPFQPYCLTSLDCPPAVTELRWITAALSLLIGGIAGVKASRLFGGRKNFTGRLLFYFSLFMFAFGPIQVVLNILDTFPNPLLTWFSSNVLLAYSGIDEWVYNLAFCFPAYALIVSLRDVWRRLDAKSWLVILFAVAIGVFYAWINLISNALGGTNTLLDTILWVWIGPVLLVIELAAAVLLLRTLGKWYVAKSITALIVLYLFVGAFLAILSAVIFSWLASAGSHSALIMAGYSFAILGYLPYPLVAIVLTQIRPRTTGRYY